MNDQNVRRIVQEEIATAAGRSFEVYLKLWKAEAKRATWRELK